MARTQATAKKTTTRTPAKKTMAKKVVANKSPAAKKAVKRPALELKPIKTVMNRSELANYLAEKTDLERKQVLNVFKILTDTMKACMMPRGCGKFQVPGVLALQAKKIPAKKGGKKVMSFGVERISKAKPATVRVRARALGSLKRAALGTE
jgi:nucleoid DNA-binding protein